MKSAWIIVMTASIFVLTLGGVRAAQQQKNKAEAEAAVRDEAAKQRAVLSAAMAKKLEYAHQLMTSLAMEDFARMANDAGELRRVGETALMKVSPDLEYTKYATEFSTVVEELGRRAKAHDLNGATLSYIRLTMNCVECHKYVRDRNILGRNR